MRNLYRGTTRDGNGRVVTSATVTVYLAGTTTAASVYTTLTGATAVNSVGSSSTDGTFFFYHDNFDYDADQLFKIVISRGGFTSATYDYVKGHPITGTYIISTAKTITTYCKPVKGVVYEKSGSGSLLFNGGFEGDRCLFFSGFAAGEVKFGILLHREIHYQWFDDDAVALASAPASGYILYLSTGITYGGGGAEIADETIGYAKMQHISATDKLLGRSTAGAGDVEEIVCTAAGRNLLDDASADAQLTTLLTADRKTWFDNTYAGQTKFPAVQNPSADANTLDDYEEGTWTPTITFGGAAVDLTYNNQNGFYTKIGNLVILSGYVALATKGTSNGSATINGLPFVIVSNNSGRPTAALTLFQIGFANQFEGWGYVGQSYIVLQEITEGGVVTNLSDADFANNSAAIISITYRVA